MIDIYYQKNMIIIDQCFYCKYYKLNFIFIVKNESLYIKILRRQPEREGGEGLVWQFKKRSLVWHKTREGGTRIKE